MSRILLLSCLAFGLALGDDADSGSSGTTKHTGNVPGGVVYAETDGRYYLYDFEVNWYQAVELCFQFGKRLATFNNETEYNQLIDLVRTKNGYNREARYWTSGSDLGRTDRYVWMSTGKPLKYTRWHDGKNDIYTTNDDGEPNHDDNSISKEVEHCVEIRADFGYKMNDNLCSVTNFVVCEDNE